MNTWIFSKNGQVTKPLDLVAAKKYVVENQDAYAWQSSYTQWLPVNSISEFSALLPERTVSAKLPQKIVDEFMSKEQALEKRFEQFTHDLAGGDASAKLLQQEIANYKQLTANLSDEVKGNVNEIEQQYDVLHAQLNELKQVVITSQQELSTIVTDFNSKVSGKSVVTTSEKATSPLSIASEKNQPAAMAKIAAELEQAAAIKAAELEQQAKVTEKAAPEVNVSKPAGKAISTRARRPTSAQMVNTRSGPVHSNSSDKTVDSAAEVSKVTSINERVKKDQAEATNSTAGNGEEDAQSPTKLESGVKNIFKSVFTKEDTASTGNKFAELVEQDEQNVAADSDVEMDNIYDDSKKARKRKRR